MRPCTALDFPPPGTGSDATAAPLPDRRRGGQFQHQRPRLGPPERASVDQVSQVTLVGPRRRLFHPQSGRGCNRSDQGARAPAATGSYPNPRPSGGRLARQNGPGTQPRLLGRGTSKTTAGRQPSRGIHPTTPSAAADLWFRPAAWNPPQAASVGRLRGLRQMEVRCTKQTTSAIPGRHPGRRREPIAGVCCRQRPSPRGFPLQSGQGAGPSCSANPLWGQYDGSLT